MVAKLIATSSSGEQEVFPLTQETTTIGRNPNNDIHISNLSVSSKHARIITILEDSFLEDLGSTNGTYVNGKLIKKHALDDGDNITFGKHRMTYQSHSGGIDQGHQQTVATSSKKPDMPAEVGDQETGKSTLKVAVPEPAGAASSSTDKEASLHLLNGANAGKELILTKALTTIGESGVQVAAITRRPDGFFLILVEGGPDNSAPKVAGVPIGSSGQQLKNHDIIEVAGVKMEFCLK